MTLCPECGWELRVGDYPFCSKSESGGERAHAPAKQAVIGDDIPGGQWIENLGHEPIKFYSKKAIRDEADRRGLRMVDRWAGPSDKFLTNWGAGIDEYTLAAATALLTRHGARAVNEPTVVCETLQTSVREIATVAECL